MTWPKKNVHETLDAWQKRWATVKKRYTYSKKNDKDSRGEFLWKQGRSKNHWFYSFSLFFCVFKKSVIRRGGFQKSKISDVPILYIISTLRLERLYESYGIRPWGLSTWKGAEPPAGPPKLSNSLGESTFPKNLYVLVSWKNLSFRTAFSKTHSQTQRMHSWIALDLS